MPVWNILLSVITIIIVQVQSLRITVKTDIRYGVVHYIL